MDLQTKQKMFNNAGWQLAESISDLVEHKGLKIRTGDNSEPAAKSSFVITIDPSDINEVIEARILANLHFSKFVKILLDLKGKNFFKEFKVKYALDKTQVKGRIQYTLMLFT